MMLIAITKSIKYCFQREAGNRTRTATRVIFLHVTRSEVQVAGLGWRVKASYAGAAG